MPFVLNTPLIFQHPQTYSETVFLIHFPQVVAAVTLLSDLEISAITGHIYMYIWCVCAINGVCLFGLVPGQFGAQAPPGKPMGPPLSGFGGAPPTSSQMQNGFQAGQGDAVRLVMISFACGAGKYVCEGVC